jgi:hypothetical protein
MKGESAMTLPLTIIPAVDIQVLLDYSPRLAQVAREAPCFDQQTPMAALEPVIDDLAFALAEDFAKYHELGLDGDYIFTSEGDFLFGSDVYLDECREWNNSLEELKEKGKVSLQITNYIGNCYDVTLLGEVVKVEEIHYGRVRGQYHFRFSEYEQELAQARDLLDRFALRLIPPLTEELKRVGYPDPLAGAWRYFFRDYAPGKVQKEVKAGGLSRSLGGRMAALFRKVVRGSP